MGVIEALRRIVEEIRREHAPDPRTAIFEVDVVSEHGRVILRGATSEPSAAEALQRGSSELGASQAAAFEVVRLPVDGAHARHHGIVRSATAPLLAGPLSAEGHLSQLVLGDRVMILRRRRKWYQCRVPDGYIGWIHRGYLAEMTEIETRAWELGTDSPLHVSLGARVLDAGGAPLVCLPWGARVGLVGSNVLLPDGSRGILHGELVPLEEMRVRFPLRGDAVVASALTWMGAPYIWGGITRSGVDCSGLVQSVFRTHGLEMPRDSDQQGREGTKVEKSGGMSNVLPGDLLFFAERGSRISHVAIAVGGSRIIHSSLSNGGVRTNDLLGDEPFERELRSVLHSVRRVIPAES